MSIENNSPGEREEIEMLLPWYATGRLEADERLRVEAYLAQHPEMRAQVEMARDEQHATIVANEAIAAPKAGGLERLRQSIDAERSVFDKARAAGGGWLGELARLFTNPTPFAVRFAGIAAAVVLLVQAAAIGTLVSQQGTGTTYQTASGNQAGETAGTRVLIQFEGSASAERIAAALRAAGAEITGGPKPGGLFEVRLSDKVLSEAERDAIVERLRQNEGLIKLVVPHG